MPTQRWVRDGRMVIVEVDDKGVVQVSAEVLRSMLTELGFVEAVGDEWR